MNSISNFFSYDNVNTSSIITTVIVVLIGIGSAIKAYQIIKKKGYLDTKSICKIVNCILDDVDLMDIVKDIYTGNSIDMSKYDTLDEFISDQIDLLNDHIYNYIQGHPKIDPLLKALVTKDNIVGISDYIINKLGLELRDALADTYNKYQKGIQEAKAIEQPVGKEPVAVESNAVEKTVDESPLETKKEEEVVKDKESKDEVKPSVEENYVEFLNNTMDQPQVLSSDDNTDKVQEPKKETKKKTTTRKRRTKKTTEKEEK